MQFNKLTEPFSDGLELNTISEYFEFIECHILVMDQRFCYIPLQYLNIAIVAL